MDNFSPDEIADALVELQQGGWQSDERFAEAYVRMRRSKGYGPIRIAIELNERGVDESIAASCLQGDDEGWMDILRDEYQRKYRGTEPEDYREKAKRMRFLQYRGFSPEKIRQVVK